MSDRNSCPCCNHRIVDRLGIAKEFSHLRCSHCSHEFFLPLAGNETIVNKTLYEQDPDYDNDLAIAGDYSDLIQWNHLKAFDFMQEEGRINTVLDVGAYNGFFVRYLRDKGLEAYGFDFNERAVVQGVKDYGLNGLLVSDIRDLTVEKFDCITAFEVIEHLEQPDEWIGQIGKRLSNGGYLILSCPNNKMLWRPPLDYPPHHLSRFSPTSLAMFVRKCGYETVSISEQMSVFGLVRNVAGVFLRDKKTSTLKGGRFRHIEATNVLKRLLNRNRVVCEFILAPVDAMLHGLGFRYISQVIVAKKCRVLTS